MYKPRMIGLGLLLMSLLAPAAMAAGAAEGTGVIKRFDTVRKLVYIDDRTYQLRDQALVFLMAYREANGVGSLIGKRIDYRPYGVGDGTYYIDLVEWSEAE